MRDNLLLLSDQQAVTAAAVSEESYDKHLASLDFSGGKPLYATILVREALTDGGSNTGTVVTVVDAANGALTSNKVTLQTIGTLPQAAAAGTILQIPVGAGLSAQQFVGFNFAPAGANLTGGKIDAWFTHEQLTGLKLHAAPFVVAS